MQIVVEKDRTRDFFFYAEWEMIKNHFAIFQKWKYKRLYIWSYPNESEYGLTNAVMWNSITNALVEGQWK